MDETIEQLNTLWKALLKLYEDKKQLPLGRYYQPYYLMNARKEDQKVELWNWINQWKDKLTVENLAALASVENNITSCRLKLNSHLIKLSLEGVVIVPISEFVSADLLLFSPEISVLAPILEMIKHRKSELLQVREFESLCMFRGQEKTILNLVCQEFQILYPEVYFKKSWFRKNELVFLPSGTFEMTALLKRASRETYKNN